MNTESHGHMYVSRNAQTELDVYAFRNQQGTLSQFGTYVLAHKFDFCHFKNKKIVRFKINPCLNMAVILHLLPGRLRSLARRNTAKTLGYLGEKTIVLIQPLKEQFLPVRINLFHILTPQTQLSPWVPTFRLFIECILSIL